MITLCKWLESVKTKKLHVIFDARVVDERAQENFTEKSKQNKHKDINPIRTIRRYLNGKCLLRDVKLLQKSTENCIQCALIEVAEAFVYFFV